MITVCCSFHMASALCLGLYSSTNVRPELGKVDSFDRPKLDSGCFIVSAMLISFIFTDQNNCNFHLFTKLLILCLVLWNLYPFSTDTVLLLPCKSHSCLEGIAP